MVISQTNAVRTMFFLFLLTDSEEEIKQGILQGNPPNSQALWFQRNITDMKDNVKNNSAAKYVDMEEVPKKLCGKGETRGLDKTAKALLKSLKETQIPKVLDKGNVVSYNIKWGEKGVDTHSNEEHAQYINKLCQDFFTKMKDSIHKAIKERKNPKLDDALFEEVVQHLVCCRKLCSSCCLPRAALDRIKSYVTGQGNTPLVIHGPQGSGKTSLVAMAANKAQSWVGSEAAVVVRFLGTTHHSSKVHSLLQSICHQLRMVLKVDCKNAPQVCSHCYLSYYDYQVSKARRKFGQQVLT